MDRNIAVHPTAPRPQRKLLPCCLNSWIGSDTRFQCRPFFDHLVWVSGPTNGGDSDQICALPPSTNSSMPVTKLESSDARKSAALAISSGEPMRPIGTVDTIRAIASEDSRSDRGVLMGPGLKTFVRTRRSFRSVVQVRANERRAALVAP